MIIKIFGRCKWFDFVCAAMSSSEDEDAVKSKKTVMIEIKGKKTPPPRGKDGIHALKNNITDTITDNVTSPLPMHPSTMFKERLIDTRKLLPTSTTTLDRVKRLQERAGMVDMKERIQERRSLQQPIDRKNRYSSSPLYHDAVPLEKTMDAMHDGVLKISDRSFCENGESRWLLCQLSNSFVPINLQRPCKP